VKRCLALVCLATAIARAEPAADDLVDVSALIPDAVLDLRYATADNFTGDVLYPQATCKLRRAVAARLAKAAALLRAQDRRLLLWDCYRPASIQTELWRRVPDERYVANPKKGSRHSRGAAIDLALVDRDGKPVTLPTSFDDFSKAAHRARAVVGARGREAKRLSAAMVKVGFVPIATEWWHFDAPDAVRYRLSDEPL
jgi:D-alanyl-D-alanine dipeptidase